jgi:hypothetical protein
MIDRMFARLRPDELDELAEASYRRRRADDLARAFTGTQHPEKPTWRAVMFRRPLFLLATSGAVAAIAAGGDRSLHRRAVRYADRGEPGRGGLVEYRCVRRNGGVAGRHADGRPVVPARRRPDRAA